jgi:hypothetical protein
MRRAPAVAGAIPDHWKRSDLLAAIIRRLASADPKDPALIERALTAAATIPYDWARSEAFARIHGSDQEQHVG